jgi:multiple antibiotic resistance protein
VDFPQFINHFIALLVVANPLSALPAVLRITRNQNLKEKRYTGLVSAFSVGIILLISTWIGTALLSVLGIGLPAFQVAGGIVVFMMALSMLSAEESPIKNTPDEHKGRHSELGAIVPLAIPIIAGPGAISTVIVSVNQFPGLLNQLLLSLSATLVAICIGILLYFAADLERIFGTAGINIINRLGGLILAAISIQIIATGLIGLFPTLQG